MCIMFYYIDLVPYPRVHLKCSLPLAHRVDLAVCYCSPILQVTNMDSAGALLFPTLLPSETCGSCSQGLICARDKRKLKEYASHHSRKLMNKNEVTVTSHTRALRR
jgi:hypothetical protein